LRLTLACVSRSVGPGSASHALAGDQAAVGRALPSSLLETPELAEGGCAWGWGSSRPSDTNVMRGIGVPPRAHRHRRSTHQPRHQPPDRTHSRPRCAGPACRSCSARPAPSPRNGPTGSSPPLTPGPTTRPPRSNASAPTSPAPSPRPPPPTHHRRGPRLGPAHGLDIPDRGRLRPEIWNAWREHNHAGQVT
jgi:hypothetical protein